MDWEVGDLPDDGPMNWTGFGSLFFERRYSPPGVFYEEGFLQLITSEPVIIEDVVVDDDPETAPLEVGRVWVTPPGPRRSTEIGQWGRHSRAPAAFGSARSTELDDAFILVVEMGAPAPSETEGFTRELQPGRGDPLPDAGRRGVRGTLLLEHQVPDDGRRKQGRRNRSLRAGPHSARITSNER